MVTSIRRTVGNEAFLRLWFVGMLCVASLGCGTHSNEESSFASSGVYAIPSEVAFGSVWDSDREVSISFRLHNATASDVTIRRISSTCGCTVPKLGGDRIAPHGSISGTAIIKLHGLAGKVDKRVHVWVDDREGPIEVSITGDVRAGFSADGRIELQSGLLDALRIDGRIEIATRNPIQPQIINAEGVSLTLCDSSPIDSEGVSRWRYRCMGEMAVVPGEKTPERVMFSVRQGDVVHSFLIPVFLRPRLELVQSPTTVELRDVVSVPEHFVLGDVVGGKEYSFMFRVRNCPAGDPVVAACESFPTKTLVVVDRVAKNVDVFRCRIAVGTPEFGVFEGRLLLGFEGTNASVGIAVLGNLCRAPPAAAATGHH